MAARSRDRDWLLGAPRLSSIRRGRACQRYRRVGLDRNSAFKFKARRGRWNRRRVQRESAAAAGSYKSRQGARSKPSPRARRQ